MASQQDDAVFDLDDDDDRSSQSQDDLEDDPEMIDDLEDDDDDEEDIRPLFPSSSAPPVPVAVPSASAVTIAAVPNGADRHHPILALPTASLSPPDPKRHRIAPPPYEAVVLPSPPQLDRKPLPPDETRRLFQRLWTDEDEIELLQGFLEYSAGQRGPHPDTALFYDQIKSKLQLDFNKNQLVEKLRRLKKKYRTIAGKIASGKDFAFKSPHDQATFEISKKIWSSSLLAAADDEDGDVKLLDDLPNNHSHHHNHQRSLPFSTTPSSRKRSRSGARQLGNSPALTPLTPALPPPLGVKIEGANHEGNNENSNCNNNNSNRSISGGGGVGNVNVNASGVIEETVRSCLSPLFKELLSGAVLGAASSSSGMFGGGRAAGGIGGLVMNAMPLGFGFGGAELGMLADEKWRKQQMLELEVYSKRLELVQDQIRVQLDELRSMGGSGGG